MEAWKNEVMFVKMFVNQTRKTKKVFFPNVWAQIGFQATVLEYLLKEKAMSAMDQDKMSIELNSSNWTE